MRRGRTRLARREYSLTESTAWRNRPYGFRGTLEQAVLLYARTQEDELPASKRKHAVRGTVEQISCEFAAREARSELQYSHEHSMKVGMHDKLYSCFDRVTPICDAITAMFVNDRAAYNDVFLVFAKYDGERRKKRCDLTEQSGSKRRRVAKHVPNESIPTWECPECGNRDVESQVWHIEGYVCTCGVVVGIHGAMIDTVRERLGAQSQDDVTRRADAPRVEGKDEEGKDCFDAGPLSAEERARKRRSDAHLSFVPARVPGLGRICDAKSIVITDRVRDTQAQQILTAREKLKAVRILEQLERLFTMFAPIDAMVKRQVRITLEQIWTLAVQHAHACSRGGGCCELSLVSRSAFIVAASLLDHTVDRLISNEIVLSNVNREHIVNLQVRMRQSTEFSSSTSISQINTTKIIITLITMPDFDHAKPCHSLVKAVPPTRAVLTTTKPPAVRNDVVPLYRTASSLSTADEPSDADEVVCKHEGIAMRDALAAVFASYKLDNMPVSARDGALQAIQSPRFMSRCREVPCLREDAKLSYHALAFCVLNAVERAQHLAMGNASFAHMHAHTPLNVPLAQRIPIDLAVAEEAITQIVLFVPAEVAAEATSKAEDDLFG